MFTIGFCFWTKQVLQQQAHTTLFRLTVHLQGFGEYRTRHLWAYLTTRSHLI